MGTLAAMRTSEPACPSPSSPVAPQPHTSASPSQSVSWSPGRVARDTALQGSRECRLIGCQFFRGLSYDKSVSSIRIHNRSSTNTNCITCSPVKDEILGELHDANVVVEVEGVVVLVHDEVRDEARLSKESKILAQRSFTS